MPDDTGQLGYYIVVSVRPSVAKRYFRGQCDLRYIFLYARDRRFYVGSPDQILDERIKLTPFDGEICEDHLPAPRHFSSSHTSDYGIEEGAVGEETLFVDGEWEMPEFGDFYKKYSDIYLYLASFEKLKGRSTSQSEKGRIINAITSKPFKGGSSYLGMFSDLRAALPYRERPGLEKIRYASPGEMDIRGDERVFSNLEKLIIEFLMSSGEIKKIHDELREFMKGLGLLKISARSPQLSADQTEFIARKCKELDSSLGVNRFDDLSTITEGNIVVTAKITLALYRRLFFASNFFAQGRVGYSTD
ncbi:MAG: hypothetical protein QNJ16_13680 [Rhodobacter sp.]|nr:hypothetical protein [Rhodobacter sp.]